MKGSSMNTHMGNITIDNEVIAQYAGSGCGGMLWYRGYGWLFRMKDGAGKASEEWTVMTRGISRFLKTEQ